MTHIVSSSSVMASRLALLENFHVGIDTPCVGFKLDSASIVSTIDESCFSLEFFEIFLECLCGPIAI